MIRRSGSGSKALIILLVILGNVITCPLAGNSATAAADTVCIIPIEGDIELGLVSFLARGLETAVNDGAGAVVLDIIPSAAGLMRPPK